MLIVPERDTTAYLGTTDGQLFKTVDGGRIWSPLYPGLSRRQIVIDTLVEEPGNGDHLYAGGWDLRSSGGGLFESLDAGRSWQQIRFPEPDVAVRGFAISRDNPAYMIAGTGAGVFVSSDHGKTWQQRGAQISAFLQAESVGIDPRDPRCLFVGTWHLGYRSTDFGKTWVLIDKGMVTDSDVFSIAIDERNSTRLYASACTGVYRSENRGSTWKRLKVLPNDFQVRAQVVAVDPSDSSKVFAGTTEGLFISRNSGQSWTRVTAPDLTINAIQIDPQNGNLVLAGTELSGVLRSEDGGISWKEANDGFVSRSISRVLPDPLSPGRFYVGELYDGKAGGLYVYDNPLNHWARVGPDAMPGGGMLSAISLPGNRGHIVGAARGIYLQRAGSDVWTALPGPIAKLTVYDLAMDASEEWIYAGTSDGVYRTRLAELDFEKPTGYTFIPRVFSLLLSQDVPGRIFAGSHLGVLRSDDFGVSWTPASDGIPEHALVQRVVFSPGQEQHLLAGTSAGLFESLDGGRHWRPAADERLGVDISSIIFLNKSGSGVLVGDQTFGGVYLSADGGRHWERIENPRFSSPVRSLAQDPLRPDVIYIGTNSEGVYRLSIQ